MTSEFYPPEGKLDRALWKVVKIGDAIYSLRNVLPKLAAALEDELEKARQEANQAKAEFEAERNSKPKVIERARGEIARNYKALYQEIALRDGEFCQHCRTTDKLTIDHVLALANGGTNDLDNLQILCRSCNSRKHAK